MLLKRLSSPKFWASLIGALFIILLFQNCGKSGGFATLPSNSTEFGSTGGAASATPTPVPPGATVTPTPVTTPTPIVSSLKKTRFYFGRSGGIDSLELDHSTGQMRQLAQTTFSGSQVGWLNFEKTGNSILGVDANGSVLQIYSYNATSGAIASVNSMTNFAAKSVHLSVQPSTTGFDLFSASYDRGVLDYYKLNQTKTQVTLSQSVSFGASAKTHSSAFDSKRSLLYVASLGLNKIDVYKFSTTGLTALTSIAVDGARTVVYDSIYDKLYVSTEIYAGNSFIRVFSIAASGASYTFTNTGSLAMPLAGGDLKINHAFGYAMATARENGKEAILGLPLNADGIQDSTRSSFSIAVTQAMPRALEVTEDGLYAVVGMNSVGAENVVAYKLSFDAQNKYVSSQKIFQSHIDNTQGYLCGLSIPMY